LLSRRPSIATRSAARGEPLAAERAGVPMAPPSSNSGQVVRLAPHDLAVSPQAARRRRRLSPRWISFVAVVVLPVALVAAYYFAVAADQYVSEFRFTLRTAEMPRAGSAWLLAGADAPSLAATDSRIVVQYVTSRAIVDELAPNLDLRRIFSPQGADWWARLGLPASIEALVAYWKNQVDAFYDQADSTVVVRVRAFAPEDALRVAQAVVAASERLVNDLSQNMRRDALRHSEEEVAQAKARLVKALADIRDFRDRSGLIDPGRTAAANATLAARLRDDLARANAELSTLRAYMRDDSPTIKVSRARIRSLETQLAGAARDLGGGDRTLSRELSAFEQLENERKFAEDAYRHALEGLDRARSEADRQQVYIASFIPPSLAEQALHPRRWRGLGVVALIAFAVWAIGSLTVQSVRDHL